ncbi:MAG: hypothetical protein SGARI_001290, partial [Bacillariaceae sp.]
MATKKDLKTLETKLDRLLQATPAANLPSNMATKDDLKNTEANMATKDDLQWMEANMATKDDVTYVAMGDDYTNLKDDMNALESKMD